MRIAKRLAAGWDCFFFAATPGTTLGLFRVAFGLVVFVTVLGVYPHRETFYGAHAIISPQDMARMLGPSGLSLGFTFLPLHEPGLGAFFLVLMTAALLLAAGVCSRLMSFLVFLGIYSLHNRNLYITNAGDLLMRIDSLVLIFADCGAELSFDRWWRKHRGERTPRMVSPWPVRLLQLQLSFLYLSTACLKLEGASWRDGTAIYYALRYLELQRFSFRYLFYYLWQIKLATWGTIVAEMSMGTLVWMRRLRYPIVLAACALHVGINLALQFPVFQYVMLTNLILFIRPEDIRKTIARREGRSAPGALKAA